MSKSTVRGAWAVVGSVLAIGIIGSILSPSKQGSTDPGTAETVAATTEPAPNAATEPEPPPAVERKVVKVTSTALHRSYDSNEVLTDEQIGGAIVEISGVVDSIGKDFMNDVVLQLRIKGEPYQHTSVSLVESERQAAAGLRKGQRIVAQCDRVAFVMGSPAGYDCALVPAEQIAAEAN